MFSLSIVSSVHVMRLFGFVFFSGYDYLGFSSALRCIRSWGVSVSVTVLTVVFIILNIVYGCFPDTSVSQINISTFDYMIGRVLHNSLRPYTSAAFSTRVMA